MTYIELQKLVYEHLMAKHLEDESFTFSVRKRFSKKEEPTYFTGTEKSNYFGFTFWLLPSSYPGASVDPLTYIVDQIKNGEVRLKLQFNMSRSAIGEQNQATLSVGNELVRIFNERSIPFKRTAPDKLIETIKVIAGEFDQKNIKEEIEKFTLSLDGLINEGIENVKRAYPDWSGGRITPSEFKEDIDNLENKIFNRNHLNNSSILSLSYAPILPKVKKSEPVNETNWNVKNIPANKPYTLNDADRDLFLDRTIIQKIQASLLRKKNIILQGAPGVGKTFCAKRFAYLQMGVKDESRIEMIQFHQSYSYEDFIRGFRPDEEGKFQLANGIFYQFCEKAKSDTENDYFFIIDEINRGNLSKIFGELLMLIEADKRGEEFGMHLTYKKKDEPKFYVPENVYIIGTMNTADHSLAIVDYALRRRFAFWQLLPNYGEKFINHLEIKGHDFEVAEIISEKLIALNKQILEDKDLGSGFMIGHSYFCNVPEDYFDFEEWYNEILEHEIKPLLFEYWFDNEGKAKNALAALEL